MSIHDNLAALRPLETQHNTAQGIRVGFLMAAATRAFGSIAKASDALAVLLAEGLVVSEPVVIENDVHTLYRLAAVAPPAIH